jgi:phage terminase small subunit
MPPTRKDSEGLTAQQRRFVELYAELLSGKRAAEGAGYSPKTAATQASELLNRPHIAAAVEAELAKNRAERAHRAERIRREIDLVALADPAEAFDPETGLLLPIHKMPEGIRKCVAGIETEELFDGQGADKFKVGELRKVKWWDKLAALKLAATEEGMLTEKLELEVKGKLEHLIAMAQARRAARKKKEAEGAK